MHTQKDNAVQITKGLYLTGIATLIILAVVMYQWVYGMQLDTGEILSVPIALAAFLKLVSERRKLSLA
ncbi:hypothetical protein AV540_18445 [Brevibacillus parabrevis]|uniref:hypothetical protein n=1 Tax=Brevibacillus parabrevis TaxID=54914 RepID=UPI0007AB49F1|nr:hypothetical protein [Brevibacillus parabrevis]KZE47750.1 hypothetical protein AV540_18445 [Brevibacillus parabrevis]